MTHKQQDLIELAWDGRAQITAASAPEVRVAVEEVIGDLNAGRIRVAERQGVGQWKVNEWGEKSGAAELPLVRQQGDARR